ncbi:transposase [Chitinophaga niabensis]|nr:transposase [Chitinophaga niabensis]
MRKSKYKETEIINALNEHERGKSINDICCELGISNATFYYWRRRYEDRRLNQLKRIRQLENENCRLKRIYANLSLKHALLKDLVSENI